MANIFKRFLDSFNPFAAKSSDQKASLRYVFEGQPPVGITFKRNNMTYYVTQDTKGKIDFDISDKNGMSRVMTPDEARYALAVAREELSDEDRKKAADLLFGASIRIRSLTPVETIQDDIHDHKIPYAFAFEKNGLRHMIVLKGPDGKPNCSSFYILNKTRTEQHPMKPNEMRDALGIVMGSMIVEELAYHAETFRRLDRDISVATLLYVRNAGRKPVVS